MELNKIYCMDNVQGMKQLDNESVDLVVTSPPYNKGLYWKDSKIGRKKAWKVTGIDYDSCQDAMSHDDYVDW